jgi:tight adherence protein B
VSARPGSARRRTVAREAQVPPFLEAVARQLRAGRTLVAALRDAAAGTPDPLGAEVRALVRRIDAGAGVRRATDHARARTASPALRRALTAVVLAHEAGGAHAAAFDAVAGSVRAGAAAARELRALATPVRVSALVIGAAPPVVLALVALAAPGTLLRAWSSPTGAAALVAGVVLDALGVWWIRALTQVAP